MPILEYQCKECEQQFETIVLGAQQPACPSCHSTKLERLLSVFAVAARATALRPVNRLGPAAPVVTLAVQVPAHWISLWAWTRNCLRVNQAVSRRCVAVFTLPISGCFSYFSPLH